MRSDVSTKIVLDYDDAKATAAFGRLSDKMKTAALSADQMGGHVEAATGRINRTADAAGKMAGSLGIGNSALTAVASASGPAGAALGQVAQSLGKVGTGMLAAGAIGYELSHIVGHLTGNVELQSEKFNEWGKSIANVVLQYTSLAGAMEADKKATAQRANDSKAAAEEMKKVLAVQEQFNNARKAFNESEKNAGLVAHFKELFRSESDVLALDQKMLDARRRRADIEKEFALAGSQQGQLAVIEKEKALQTEIMAIEQRRAELRAQTAQKEVEANEKRKQQMEELKRQVDEKNAEDKRQLEEIAKKRQEEHEKELERIKREKEERERQKDQRIKDIFALSKASQDAAAAASGGGGGVPSPMGGDGAAVAADPFAGLGPFARAALGSGFNRNGIATGGAVVTPGIGSFPGLGGFPGMTGIGGGGGVPSAQQPGGSGSLEDQMKALFQSKLGKIDDQDVKERAFKNFRDQAGADISDRELTSNRRRIFKGGATAGETEKARQQLEEEAQKEIEERLKALNKQGTINDKQLEATKRAVEEYKNTQQRQDQIQADLDDVLQTLEVLGAGANNREARRRAQRGARGN